VIVSGDFFYLSQAHNGGDYRDNCQPHANSTGGKARAGESGNCDDQGGAEGHQGENAKNHSGYEHDEAGLQVSDFLPDFLFGQANLGAHQRGEIAIDFFKQFAYGPVPDLGGVDGEVIIHGLRHPWEQQLFHRIYLHNKSRPLKVKVASL
jgi:hypothetical protein